MVATAHRCGSDPVPVGGIVDEQDEGAGRHHAAETELGSLGHGLVGEIPTAAPDTDSILGSADPVVDASQVCRPAFAAGICWFDEWHCVP